MSTKILIVEDNPLNLKLFQDLLAAQGFEISTSPDGSDAIELAKTVQPALILMDIHLPELSGMDLTRELKQLEETKHIPVIAVTAFAMKGDKEKIMDCGCTDYISKPITSIPDFVKTIKTHLENIEAA